METIGFLEFEFRILSLTGVWRPIDWTSKSQRILYKIYSSFCVFEIFSLVAFQLLLLALTEVNIQVLTETLFTLLTELTVCTKTVNFIFRRDKLLGLANMLTKSWCVPQNPEEEEIQKKSNNLIKWAIDFLVNLYISVEFLKKFVVFKYYSIIKYVRYLLLEVFTDNLFWIFNNQNFKFLSFDWQLSMTFTDSWINARLTISEHIPDWNLPGIRYWIPRGNPCRNQSKKSTWKSIYVEIQAIVSRLQLRGNPDIYVGVPIT